MCATGNKDATVSTNIIGKQLLGLYSTIAWYRMLKKARIKRKRFDKEDLGQFSLVDREEKRWKYSEEEIEELRVYMLNNTYTRQSPMTNDTVVKKDYNGDAVLDNNGEKIKVQKVLILACPHQLHVHMMKDESEGGYKDAKDKNGDPKFSLSTVVAYWPNWLVIMKDSHMMMCGCKTCNENGRTARIDANKVAQNHI